VGVRRALVFEVKVAAGKRLLSSAQLSDASGPPAKQLLHSLLKYRETDQFNPSVHIDVKLVTELLTPPATFVFDPFTMGSPDELKPISTATNNH